jgi:predicted TPR repeat methyltransferase
MAYRCLELLNLTEGTKYLLDIGCGSGLSGEILEEEGHLWVGLDISPSMLGKEYIYIDQPINLTIYIKRRCK